MTKFFVAGRDCEGEWYDKAREFLKRSHGRELEMTIGTEGDDFTIFDRTVEALRQTVGCNVTLDTQAAVVVGIGSFAATGTDKCLCKCGGNTSTCGGGGGG